MNLKYAFVLGRHTFLTYALLPITKQADERLVLLACPLKKGAKIASGGKKLDDSIHGLGEQLQHQAVPKCPNTPDLTQKLFIKSLDSASNFGISF